MTIVKFKNSDLLERFSLIQAARGGGKDKPILQTIKVEGLPSNDKIRLTASNRLAYAHVELEATTDGEFTFCADPLVFQILGTFPSDAVIEFEIEGKELIIRYGKKVHKVMTIPVDDFEKRPKVEYNGSMDIAPIVTAMEKSRIATANDAHRPALQCFNISTNGSDGGAILTADGKQFMKFGSMNLPGSDTLPRQTVIKEFGPLLKFISNDAEAKLVFGSGEYTGFCGLGAELIVQKVNAKSFDLEKLFQTALEKPVLAKVIIPTHTLKSTLAVCRIYEMRGLKNGNPNTAVLNVKADEVRMSTSISGLSNMDEALENVIVEVLDGDEQTLQFSAELLAELLAVTEDESIELSILEGGVKSPFVVTFPENENCWYLQMPTQQTGG